MVPVVLGAGASSRRPTAAVLFALAAAGPGRARAEPGRPTVRAAPATGTIAIDGELSEPAWARAAEIAGLTERVPVPGRAAAGETHIRVLYDRRYLYVGATLRAAPGGNLDAFEMQRDSFGTFDDEHLGVYVGAGDGRSARYFGVNSNGTQYDGAAVNRGERLYREFDAVWWAAVERRGDRWSVEMRIPLHALDLRLTGPHPLVPLQLIHRHAIGGQQHIDDWSLTPAGVAQDTPEVFGHLEGLTGATGGRVVSLLPYVLGSSRGNGEPARARAGGDARFTLGRETWVHLSLFTDLQSGVDLDDPHVNLNRFGYYLPERRPFFLGGLDVFERTRADTFSLSTFWLGSPFTILPFFSRAIGYAPDGEPVDVWGGARVYGHAGGTGFGLLEMVTQAPDTAHTVARVIQKVGDGGVVGAIVTARSRTGAGDYLVGLDYNQSASRGRLRLSASADSVAPEAGQAWRPAEHGAGSAAIAWQAEPFRPSLTLTWIGERFRPPLGFTERTGVAGARAAFPLVWRNLGPLAELRLEGGTQVLAPTDDLTRITTAMSAARLSALLASPALFFQEAAVQVGEVYELVTDPFELFPGHVVPAGDHGGPAIVVSLGRPRFNAPGVNLSATCSDAYLGGRLRQASMSLDWPLSRHLRLRGVAEPGRAIFGDQVFDFAAASGTAVAALSPDLTFDATLQYSSLTRAYTGLARLRVRPSPAWEVLVQYDATGPAGAVAHEALLKVSAWHDLLL